MSDASFGQLDALITKALRMAEMRSAGMGEEAQPIGELYTVEGCARIRARAVRDALVAEGEQMWRTGRYGFYHDASVGKPMLVLPLGRETGETP